MSANVLAFIPRQVLHQARIRFWVLPYKHSLATLQSEDTIAVSIWHAATKLNGGSMLSTKLYRKFPRVELQATDTSHCCLDIVSSFESRLQTFQHHL